MILHVATTAPFAVRALADTAPAFHMGGATAGLAAGTVAMLAVRVRRPGLFKSRHRKPAAQAAPLHGVFS
jgi:hypothetical protein